MRRIIAVILLLLFSTAAIAQSYFVDATSGDDNRDGMSEANAWKTLGKVNSTSLAPGDSVRFKCGETWRGTLVIPGSGVTFGGYLPGCAAANKPVISGADVVPASSWIAEGGNIYSAPMVFSPLPATVLNETFNSNVASWYPDYFGGAPYWQPSCTPTGGGCMGIPGGSNAIRVNLSVAYGKSYTVRFSARTDGATQTIAMGLRRNEGNYYFIEDFESPGARRTFSIGPSWKTYEYHFSAINTQPNAIRMDIGNLSQSGTLFVDDLNIIENAAEVRQVFVDGAPLNIAHYPNNGSVYFTINAPISGKESFTTGTDLDSALSADGLALSDQDFIGAGVHLRTAHFNIEDREVYSYGNKLITLNASTDYAPPAGWGYYLDNKVWMLASSTGGGWAYDRHTQRLYVKMPDGSHPGDRVEVNYRDFAIFGVNRTNIVIDGLNLQKAGTGVGFNNSDHFTITNTDVSRSALHGLAADGVGNGVIDACTIDQSGSQGIVVNIRSSIDVPSTTYSFSVTGNVVSNTDVRLSGGMIVSLPVYGGYGINVAGPATAMDGPMDPVRNLPYTLPRLVISGNTVRNSGQVGIGFARAEATVQNNIVEDSCWILDDCGAIYAGGLSFPNGQIIGNIMINSYGNANGRPAGSSSAAQGLYLDDMANGLTVTGNTVVNADTVQLHRAFNNTFQGNTFYGIRRYGIWFQEDNHGYGGAGGQMVNNSMNGNIVFPFTSNAPLEFNSGLYNNVACVPADDNTCFWDMLRPAANNSFSGNTYSGLYSDYVAMNYFRDPAPTYQQLSLTDWQAEEGRDPGPAVFKPFVIRPFRILSAVTSTPPRITNGFFEGDVNGWSSWSTDNLQTITAQASCGGTGGGCLKFATGGAEISLLMSNLFSVVQGKTYLIEFKASSGANNVDLSVVLRRNQDSSELSSYQWIISNTAWKRFGVVFKVTDTRSDARLDFNVPAGQVVYLDNVSITEVITKEHTDYSADSRILVNMQAGDQPFYCPDIDFSRCNSYIDLNGNPVTWQVTLAGYSSKILVWNANPFKDTDRDWVTDGEDACPQSTQGVDAANSSGCAPTDLWVALSPATQTVSQGNGVTFFMALRNLGPDQAGNVNATLSLPSGISPLNATPGQGSCNIGANTVTCAVGTMANGQLVIVTVNASAVSVGSSSVTASITGAGADTSPANNTATSSVTVNPSADLSVSVSDTPDPAKTGTPMTYSVTVTNAGPSATTNVAIAHTLPTGVTGSGVPSQGSCTGTGVISCNLGTLANGQSATVTVTATPGAEALFDSTPSSTLNVNISATTTVSAAEPDPVPANNSSSTTTNVLLACLGQPVTKRGTSGNDGTSNKRFAGGNGADVIHTLSGADWVDGKGGNDTICGGAGNDNLIGGSGNDVLSGGSGMDTCSGGSGTDTSDGSCESWTQ